jgi:serine/threonine protein kinase
MAPEQLRGERADERSDIFSFCVSLYEAIYGERPFDGHTVTELVSSITESHRRATPASDAPAWLYRAIAVGLAAEPEERYASMRELLAALEERPRRGRFAVGIGAAGLAATAIIVIATARAEQPLHGNDAIATALLAKTPVAASRSPLAASPARLPAASPAPLASASTTLPAPTAIAPPLRNVSARSSAPAATAPPPPIAAPDPLGDQK